MFTSIQNYFVTRKAHKEGTAARGKVLKSEVKHSDVNRSTLDGDKHKRP